MKDGVPEVGDVWRYGRQAQEYEIIGRTPTDTGWRTDPGTFFLDEQFEDGRLTFVRTTSKRGAPTR